MDFYIAGKGQVGTALISFFKSKNRAINDFNEEDSGKTGILFAALPDDHLLNYLLKIREKNSSLNIIHFSGAAKFDLKKCYLMHPYASITKKSDFSNIVFTFWGEKNPTLETVLKKTGLNIVYAGIRPTPLYHISAVMSGNFTQFFFIAATELLKKQGFSKDESIALIRQLTLSSIENCITSGISGITGPAARGDKNTVLFEKEILSKKDEQLAEVFESINKLISLAVKNGAVFK
ncbi:MAG: DUF2520 domain-containing protein [bacterium]